MDAARFGSQATSAESGECCGPHYIELHEKAIRYIVCQLNRYMLTQREVRTGCLYSIKSSVSKICCFVGGKLYGNYLITGYIVVKLLYLGNAVGQVFLIEAFLNIEYRFFGVHIVERMFRGEDWSHSERFPRVTLCEFEIRHQSRVHNYIVQCALTM